MLPAEMGCGSGMSCWQRLRDWHEAGVWAALHRVLLERLQAAGQVDWRRAALDSASVPAKGGIGAASIDRTEPDRSRQTRHQAPHRGRRQRHTARRADRSRQPARQPDAGTHVGGHPAGAQRQARPTATAAGQAARRPPICFAACPSGGSLRDGLRPPTLPPRVPHPRHPAPHRAAWCREQRPPRAAPLGVERTHAWQNRYRRLAVRYERRADIYQAFTTLGCTVVCFRQIRQFC